MMTIASSFGIKRNAFGHFFMGIRLCEIPFAMPLHGSGIVGKGELMREKLYRYYRSILFFLVFVVLLGLTYIRLRGNDSLYAAETEIGYVDHETAAADPGLVAEGCEQVYLYPGEYRVVIDARTESEQAYFQVVDRWSNTILAQQSFTPGEEFHVLEFTTTDYFEDVVIRSYLPVEDEGNELKLYGYTFLSLGAVCEDAKWTIGLLAILGIAFWLLIRSEKRQAGSSREWLILLSAAMLASLPFAGKGIPAGHDLYFHTGRIYSLGQAILHGQLPQRLSESMGGYSIIPIMYPELLLTGAGIMVAGNATVYLAVKVTFIFITLLTAFLAYFAAEKVTDQRTALLFSLFYLFNPYRLNNLFVRGAIGEAMAMAFLPLIAVGMYQIFHGDAKDGRRSLILGYTGLISSHIATTLIAAVFCLLYVAGAFLLHPVRFLRNAKRLLVLAEAALMTFLLNLWFLLPFSRFFSWKFYISNYGSQDYIQGSCLNLWRMFMWPTGYGMAAKTEEVQTIMPLTVGPVLLMGMVLFAGMLLKERSGGSTGTVPTVRSLKTEEAQKETQVTSQAGENGRMNREGSLLQERERKIGIICLALGLFSVYLCSELFPWTMLNERFSLFAKTLGSIQFSWRILMMAALFLTAVLTIVLRALWRQRQDSALYSILCGGVTILAVFCAIAAGTNYLYTNPDYIEDRFDNKLSVNYDYVLSEQRLAKDQEIDDWIKEGRGPAALTEQVQITGYRNQGQYSFSFDDSGAETEQRVMVPVFWYGLHRCYLTDESGNRLQELSCSMNEEYQFTDVTLPAGVENGRVVLVFEPPVLFTAACWVSIVSALLLAGWEVFLCYRRRTA